MSTNFDGDMDEIFGDHSSVIDDHGGVRQGKNNPNDVVDVQIDQKSDDTAAKKKKKLLIVGGAGAAFIVLVAAFAIFAGKKQPVEPIAPPPVTLQEKLPSGSAAPSENTTPGQMAMPVSPQTQASAVVPTPPQAPVQQIAAQTQSPVASAPPQSQAQIAPTMTVEQKLKKDYEEKVRAMEAQIAKQKAELEKVQQQTNKPAPVVAQTKPKPVYSAPKQPVVREAKNIILLLNDGLVITNPAGIESTIAIGERMKDYGVLKKVDANARRFETDIGVWVAK